MAGEIKEGQYPTESEWGRSHWVTRGHQSHPLGQVSAIIRRNILATGMRLVKYWNRLLTEVVASPSLRIFKSKLNRHLTKTV